MLISIGLNTISIFLLFFLPLNLSSNVHGDSLGFAILGFILIIISLLVQFVIALFFLNNEKKRPIGQGMLLGAGIVSLIGLSICSSM